MRIPLRTALAAVVLICVPAKAQLFGTNSGTPVDYIRSYMTDSVNVRDPGQVGAGYNPNPSASTGSPNVTLIGPTGFYSGAANYENASGYRITFNAPNPGAVNVAVGGMFSGLSNVQISGNTYSATFSIFHDGGNLLAGGGEIDLTGGLSASNPVTNFKVVRPGGNASAVTPLFASYASEYQGIRWMNSSNVNNQTKDLTAADLLPPGQNIGTFGTSYADQARMTGQIPNDGLLWTNVPAGADASFVRGMADQIAANLPAGKRVRFEYANEPWNFAFSHVGKIYSLAQADPRVPSADTFTMVARETGLRTADLFSVFLNQWVADGRNPADAEGFLNSQGANSYFANTAVDAVRGVYGSGLGGIKSRGISFYPGDNLSGASSVDQLVAALYADLPRQEGYLRGEVAAAAAEGLTPGIYEWSPEGGYLTLGGVPQNVVDAFRADPRSKQWVLDEWNAIHAILGPVPNSFAMEFTVDGTGWDPQIDPRGPHELAQQAIDQISGQVLAPEPSSLAMLALALPLLCRRYLR